MKVMHFDATTGETEEIVDTSKVVHLDHDGTDPETSKDYWSGYTEGQGYYVVMTSEERDAIVEGCAECEEFAATA